MKKATILFTTQCTLSCLHCCNRLPEVKERIKMDTFEELSKKANDYSFLHITGGEPLLEQDKIKKFIKLLRKWSLHSPMLYLYTNGTLVCTDEYILNQLSGITLGHHGLLNHNSLVAAYDYYKRIGKSVRVAANKGLYEGLPKSYKKDFINLEVNWWEKDKCKLDGDFFLI